MKVFASILIFAIVPLGQTSFALEPLSAGAVPPMAAGQPSLPPGSTSGGTELKVVVNKSIVLDHPAGIRRVSITNPEIAEAVAVSSSELLVNGKAPGDTSLFLWDRGGLRTKFDVHVVPNDSKLELVRAQLISEVGPNVALAYEDGNVFLRGTVADETAANRAASIVATLGKVVNLLRVQVPAEEPQILLKVRFATVSRAATSQLGFNFLSQNIKGYANTTTGQYGQYPQGNFGQQLTFTNFLNIFYYRPDLNIGAMIEALEARSLAQILAEPNLLTVSGKPASFLAGGEFPFPTIQGGASGVGQITIQFKEFGIKLNFTPVITPRGTIRLVLTPEVSSLDYTNGLTVSGFTVPGLATRRVTTEIELQNRQSFVIAGLLNNQVTEQLDKMPGIGNIPVLGKLFQSRSLTKNNDELLVLVTPEIVRPMAAGVKAPELNMPLPFMKGTAEQAPRTPGAEVTGPIAPLPKFDSLPLEQLTNSEQTNAPTQNPNSAPLMVVQPVQLTPATSPNSQSSQPPPGGNH